MDESTDFFLHGSATTPSPLPKSQDFSEFRLGSPAKTAKTGPKDVKKLFKNKDVEYNIVL